MPRSSVENTREERFALVSYDVPKLHALLRTVQRYNRLRPRHWRWLGALSLSVTYGVLVLLSSLCVATGLLHVQVPPEGHHHHTGAEAHHHAPPDSHPAPPVPDLCDLVHQMCTALVLWSVPLPMLTWSPRLFPVPLVQSVVSALPPSSLSIRAPPALFS
jgi:hypothetical protein